MEESTPKFYIGRPVNIVPLNLSFTREAAELLAELAPNKKARGAYLSRLLLEERARAEERRRLRSELSSVLS